MAVDREHILNIMKSRTITIDEFNYDNLICPPIYSMFTQEDIDRLYQLASSIRYSAKTEFKHKEIDRIMRSRGFVKFGAGTNRLVYRPLESDLFLSSSLHTVLVSTGIPSVYKDFIALNISLFASL